MIIYRYSALFLFCLIICLCKKPLSPPPESGPQDSGLKPGDYEMLKVTNNPKPQNDTDMPALTNTTIFQNGTNLEALERNTLACYTYFWRATIKGMSAEDRQKGMKIIQELPGTIKIAPISDNIALVTWPRRGMDVLNDVTNIQDVWVLNSEVWKPQLGTFIPYQKAILVDLNKDGDEDIILQGGCCDTTGIDIYINEKGQSLRYAQHISVIAKLETSYRNNCQASIKATNYQDDKLIKTLKFDCTKNRFE